MKTQMKSKNSIILPAILMMATFTVAGCQQSAVRDYEFSRGETVRLQEERGQHRIAAAEFDADPATLSARAEEIRDAYARRGTGPLHLAVAAPSRSLAEAWGEALMAQLAAEGFNLNALVLTPVVSSEGGAVVSYRALDVVLPDCGGGDYPSPMSNSGCAIERQIGMMVARPADLAGRGGTGPFGSAESALAVQRMHQRQEDDRASLLDPVRTTDVGAQ